jgi:hypothetical protein
VERSRDPLSTVVRSLDSNETEEFAAWKILVHMEVCQSTELNRRDETLAEFRASVQE